MAFRDLGPETIGEINTREVTRSTNPVSGRAVEEIVTESIERHEEIIIDRVSRKSPISGSISFSKIAKSVETKNKVKGDFIDFINRIAEKGFGRSIPMSGYNLDLANKLYSDIMNQSLLVIGSAMEDFNYDSENPGNLKYAETDSVIGKDDSTQSTISLFSSISAHVNDTHQLVSPSHENTPFTEHVDRYRRIDPSRPLEYDSPESPGSSVLSYQSATSATKKEENSSMIYAVIKCYPIYLEEMDADRVLSQNKMYEIAYQNYPDNFPISMFQNNEGKLEFSLIGSKRFGTFIPDKLVKPRVSRNGYRGPHIIIPNTLETFISYFKQQ
jgi:hypothetical protein